MLILTRRVGEVINIGDEVEVRVLKIDKGAIRIGINAPKNISVDREEIYRKKNIEKELNGEKDNENV